jgi:hypothetical protein
MSRHQKQSQRATRRRQGGQAFATASSSAAGARHPLTLSVPRIGPIDTQRLCSLRNPGVLCYMIVVLVALAHCDVLREAVERARPIGTPAKSQRDALLKSLKEVLERLGLLHAQSQGMHISCNLFYSILQSMGVEPCMVHANAANHTAVRDRPW